MKRKNKPYTVYGLLIAVFTVLGVIAPLPPSPARSEDPYKIETYSYNPAGKPDPFNPLVKKEEGVKKKSSGSAFLTPLQRQDIGQFRLVGIADSGSRKIAMVVDQKGKNYIISQGTHIGLNNGRVSKILDDQIIIEEKLNGNSGKSRVNRLTLKLYRYQEEEKP
ncbi:MAG: pilus assembly protein PilP [Syntrophales bacterium]